MENLIIRDIKIRDWVISKLVWDTANPRLWVQKAPAAYRHIGLIGLRFLLPFNTTAFLADPPAWFLLKARSRTWILSDHSHSRHPPKSPTFKRGHCSLTEVFERSASSFLDWIICLTSGIHNQCVRRTVQSSPDANTGRFCITFPRTMSTLDSLWALLYAGASDSTSGKCMDKVYLYN